MIQGAIITKAYYAPWLMPYKDRTCVPETYILE
ncbi:MAG: hypothetical protein JWQ24_2966 [Tardiphaga sp.]|nr:hypothetical protein [Tardiphaga sp.]